MCKSVSKMVGNEGTPARLEPVQQYLDTSFLDIPTFVDLVSQLILFVNFRIFSCNIGTRSGIAGVRETIAKA